VRVGMMWYGRGFVDGQYESRYANRIRKLSRLMAVKLGAYLPPVPSMCWMFCILRILETGGAVCRGVDGDLVESLRIVVVALSNS